ncbi:polysaccharide deacetylase family protein [Patescibacteria group bacterium]|nr:polysaccharide deacetylase family protein [Patescibacteria group bacterium]
MIWINFLHLYQPANIDDYHIKEALVKSYWRLLRLLEENPRLRMTFNVSGCLLERLESMAELDFIKTLKKLNESGRLELVSSAAYHGFLPLLPEAEVRRQIKENEIILQKFFGSNFKTKGFFLPEMSYSPALAKIVKSLGYEWIILDEISAANKMIDLEQIFIDEASGLKVIFRQRDFSRSYPPDEVYKLLSANKKIAISATDAELYGLRHEDPTGEMERIAADERIETKTISDYINSFESKNLLEIKLRESSWESEERDIKKGQPFILWFDKKNPIHRDLWRLSHISLELGDKFKNDKNIKWHRWHLVRGLASCSFWWSSAKDFTVNFGPYAWNPDIVERGLGDLLRSIRTIEDKKSLKDKLKAEALALRLKKNLWRCHWLKHWS